MISNCFSSFQQLNLIVIFRQLKKGLEEEFQVLNSKMLNSLVKPLKKMKIHSNNTVQFQFKSCKTRKLISLPMKHWPLVGDMIM